MGGEALQFTKKRKAIHRIAFQLFYLRNFNSIIIER